MLFPAPSSLPDLLRGALEDEDVPEEAGGEVTEHEMVDLTRELCRKVKV